MTLLKKNLLKIHLHIAIFLLLNFICNISFGVSVNLKMIFILKITFYLSGIILLFQTIKPFQKISIYFSLFILSPVLILIGWLIDGIFGAILASIFLFFLAPNEKIYQKENISIYKKFNGFMGRCCDYEFTKNEYFIFERKVADLNFENVDFKKVKMKLENDTLQMKFVLKEYNEEGYDFPKDSIVKLSVK